MSKKLTWKKKTVSASSYDHLSQGTAYRTRYTQFVISSHRNSYTGKLETHLQCHLAGQPFYLSIVPVMYGTIAQCKAHAQKLADEELEYKGY